MLVKRRQEQVIMEYFTKGKFMLVKGNFIIKHTGSKISVSRRKREVVVHRIEYYCPHEVKDNYGNEIILYTTCPLSKFAIKLWKDLGNIKVYTKLIDILMDVEQKTGKEVVKGS